MGRFLIGVMYADEEGLRKENGQQEHQDRDGCWQATEAGSSNSHERGKEVQAKSSAVRVMPGGRPSKYTDDILVKAQAYVDGGYLQCGDVIPQMAGLAIELKITRETVHDWANDPSKPEFSYIVAQCLRAQERKLLNGSLTGDLNPTIAKLILTKHGYSERIQQELTGADGGSIKTEWTVRVVDARNDTAK